MDDYGNDDGCELCGSHRFHIEDGISYCENGHQQAGLERAEDEADFGTQGKRVRKKEHKVKLKVSKVFRGKKAYNLFLQAYQFILWKQCYALVQNKGLPEELWTVVRDLWTLRLSKLLHKLEDATMKLDDSEALSSSAPESDTETDLKTSNESYQYQSSSPTLIESLALSYMGILLLKLPVSLATLFRWVREEDITYLRAIRHVPAEMRERLPGEYHEALDTASLLTPDTLQNAVFQLLNLYGESFGMEAPAINWKFLLFEHVKDLALPLEIYKASQTLNKILGFDFRFDMSISRRRTISLPSAQLMSLIIVSVKLLYPFDSDSVKRYPKSFGSPAALRINWNTWISSRTLFTYRDKADDKLPKGSEAMIKDVDIFSMSDQQLDQYMDWYQRTWAKNKTTGESLNLNTLDMFPLKVLPQQLPSPDTETERETAVQDMLREVQASLKFRRPISNDEAHKTDIEVCRPGAQYMIFRTVDELVSQPVANAFYEAAAETACLSLPAMVRAVCQTERRITIWRRAKRRGERFGDEMDLAAEGLNITESGRGDLEDGVDDEDEDDDDDEDEGGSEIEREKDN